MANIFLTIHVSKHQQYLVMKAINSFPTTTDLKCENNNLCPASPTRIQIYRVIKGASCSFPPALYASATQPIRNGGSTQGKTCSSFSLFLP